MAGHGKCEVDSAGGGVKTHLTKMATSNEMLFFNNAKEAKEILENTFNQELKSVTRIFCLEGIIEDTDDGIPFKGSSQFHFMRFYATGDIVASNYFCSCDECLTGDYAKCTNNMPYFCANFDRKSPAMVPLNKSEIWEKIQASINANIAIDDDDDADVSDNYQQQLKGGGFTLIIL